MSCIAIIDSLEKKKKKKHMAARKAYLTYMWNFLTVAVVKYRKRLLRSSLDKCLSEVV